LVLEQIRQFLKNVPFRPFEIHCSSGEVLRVQHLENAEIVAQGVVVVALPANKGAMMISPLHIISARVAQEVSA
jgi:hypothetical protein